MKIKVVNTSPHPLPTYETEGAAGMDLRAYIDKSVVLSPLQRHPVPTGLYLSLPTGYEAQIRPRSGLSLKKGLTLPNAPGTIDSDYRGELKVLMVNLSNEEQEIHNGDRIAQMILSKYERVEWQEVETLDTTKRGAKGFGHTGTK